MRSAALLLAALALSPAAAEAAVGIEGSPDTGPVLGAGHVIWGDSPDLYHDDLRVHAANLSGHSAVVASYPPAAPGWHQYFPSLEAGLAGSASRFAYIRQGNDGRGTESVSELWTVSEVGSERLDSRCYPTSVDVDGDRVAWGFLNHCDGTGLSIQDLGSGAPAERMPVPVGGAHEVKLAGSYVAWSEMAFWENPKRNEVVVYDWVDRSVAYRVNVEPLIPPDHPHGYQWHYGLQPDGKLVMAYRRLGFGDPAQLAWFSPSEPVPHVIPVSLHNPHIAVAGDLVGGCRRDPPDAVVFDLDGRVVDRLDTIDRTKVCRVAFDGERVAWLNGARKPALYFDSFPASEPAVGPLVEKREQERVRPGLFGTVILEEQHVDCTSFVVSGCRVETTLRTARARGALAAATVVGRSSYRVQAGRAEPLAFRLTRAGRRLIRRDGKLRARMRVTVESPLSDRTSRGFRVVLLRPR